MNNYCPDLFNTIFIQKKTEDTVEIGHCCVSKLSIPEKSIEFDNVFLTNNRQHFLTTGELPPACQYCVNAEEKGLISRRINRRRPNDEQQQYPTDIVLEHLDYNCDNICNLKCIICSGYYSSAWIEDEIALGRRSRFDQKIKPTKHNTLLYSVDVSKLRSVYFNGGEPLMTRDHLNVMNYIVANGDPANATLHYSSNGTFPLTDELTEVWAKFKTVYINFSIDATDVAFEYIRFPAKWDHVTNTIETFNLPNIIIRLTTAIGVHNILYFGELYSWATERKFDIYLQDVNGQSGLSVRNFPESGKEYLLSYLNKLPDSLNKTTLINLANTIAGNNLAWQSYLDRLDQIRGNNWRTSLSRLYGVSGQI
jgi:hypothetical protein